MSQKVPAKGSKWVKQKKLSKFNEDFIKKYDEDCNKGYFLEVDIDYPKELFNLHKDLPFLPERKKVEKVDDVERWFDTSNYDKNDERPLLIEKIKKHLVFLKMN